MRIRLVIAAALVLALAGCAAEQPAATPTPTTTSPETLLNPELVPQELLVPTAESAAVEATRLLDAIESLVESGGILEVTNNAQVAPAADDLPAYFVAERHFRLDPNTDPLALAQTVAAVMRKSGWTSYEEVNEGGQYIAALSGGPADAPWFALVGGDTTIAGESHVTVQFASPDLVE